MHVSMADSLLLSVIGIAIVFLGLVFLMIVIFVLSRIAGTKKKPVPAAAAAAPAPAQAPPPPAAREEVLETGKAASAESRRIELTNVPARTAAMLMAIVADKLKTPPSELRFISARQLEEEKVQGE